MQSEAFLDASFAIALSARTDKHHAAALALADALKASQTHLITTHAVLLEIGNAMSRQRYRYAAVRLLFALQRDPLVEIVPLTTDLYAQALQLYAERADKEWGLTDCISFVVMRGRQIEEALTADQHFQQAGFRALLLDEVRY